MAGCVTNEREVLCYSNRFLVGGGSISRGIYEIWWFFLNIYIYMYIKGLSIWWDAPKTKSNIFFSLGWKNHMAPNIYPTAYRYPIRTRSNFNPLSTVILFKKFVLTWPEMSTAVRYLLETILDDILGKWWWEWGCLTPFSGVALLRTNRIVCIWEKCGWWCGDAWFSHRTSYFIPIIFYSTSLFRYNNNNNNNNNVRVYVWS